MIVSHSFPSSGAQFKLFFRLDDYLNIVNHDVYKNLIFYDIVYNKKNTIEFANKITLYMMQFCSNLLFQSLM